MNDRDLVGYDAMIAASPRAPRLHSFSVVRERSRRTSRVRVAVMIGFAGVALALAAALATPGTEPELSAAAVSRQVDIGSGLQIAAPSGGFIAVSDAIGVRIHDATGRMLVSAATPVRYLRWLPDASGVIAQVDRPGATAATRLPFVVLERDGRVTPLGAELAGTAAAYLSVSPDGSTIAAQDDAAIVLLDRAGIAAPRALTDNATLVGWDALGRVLAREGASLRAFAPSGTTTDISVPNEAVGRLEARLSPDRTATVIAAAGAAWSFEADQLRPLPSGITADLFVGSRELLGRRDDGRAVAYDVRAGTMRALNAVFSETMWRARRAVSDGIVALFTPLGGEARLVDLATGDERVVRGLPAASTLQSLSEGRFLVTGGPPRVLAFRE